MDQLRALRLAAEAAGHLEDGRLAEAERLLQDAVEAADPRHHATPDVHARHAEALAALHRLGDAAREYERALHLELRNRPDESHPPVVAARYVLGEHYLRMGEPESARRVIAPSLSGSGRPLAWIVEAEALLQCGAVEDARAAADRALALAADPEQRERIRARLAEAYEGGA